MYVILSVRLIVVNSIIIVIFQYLHVSVTTWRTWLQWEIPWKVLFVIYHFKSFVIVLKLHLLYVHKFHLTWKLTFTTHIAVPGKLHLLNLIGCGSFGKVFKAVWRGSIVAAKVLPVSQNDKTLKNELDFYRFVQEVAMSTLEIWKKYRSIALKYYM